MKKSQLLFSGLLLVVASAAGSQSPVASLATPPPNARHFLIQSTGGKHGDSWMWLTADGTHMGRESMNLRGQAFDSDFSGNPGSDAMPALLKIRGYTPNGDAAEDFAVDAGTFKFKSPLDAGNGAYGKAAFYLPVGGPAESTAWLLERILASPDHSLALLPHGQVHAEKIASLDVGTGAAGAPKQRVDLWSVSGLNTSPTAMWADSKGRFFGLTSGIAWLQDAYIDERSRMEKAQTAALARGPAKLARELVKIPRSPVAFTNVRLFDADKLQFLSDQTVVVDKNSIAAVGPSSTTKPPTGSQIIEGRNKTLIPGLWDCHMHVGDDYTGLQELSLGVTSVRDPGNDDQLTIDRRTRAASGELLFPHVYPSSLIDGKGPYTAQVANVATTQAEAIALVDRAKANGFTGIKFYGTFNSAWLPASIAEAHKLGLHVHGHIPVGLRTMDAINDGYDEVTHINWIIMQAMPQSVIDVSNGIMRFEGPGRFAKDVDLNSAPINLIVQTMASRHIYNDPTMVAFEGLYVPDNGDLSPAYSAFIGTLPTAAERGFRSGGFAVPKDLTRADYRASWAKMVELLRKMHQAGVPIVAGTDGSGIELVHELEIYREAGFSAAEALSAATIEAARLVGQDQHTGSIKVGKAADLALIDGDPSKDIAALRQTRIVMLDGKLLDADSLRKAAGFSGRPH